MLSVKPKPEREYHRTEARDKYANTAYKHSGFPKRIEPINISQRVEARTQLTTYKLKSSYEIMKS